MRSFRIGVPSGVALATMLLLSGCSGGGGGVARHIPVPSPSSGAGPLADCGQASTAGSLTVCVRVPNSQSGVTAVTITLFSSLGDQESQKTLTVAQCPSNAASTEHACTATFSTSTQTGTAEVDANGSAQSFATGIFPYASDTQPALLSAVVGGSVSSVSLAPFSPTLPLTDSEPVGVVARDASGSVVIGTYNPAISLSATTNLALQLSTEPNLQLQSSLDAEEVEAAWQQFFAGGSSGTVTAAAAGISASAQITPTSGIIYHSADTIAGYGFGPLAPGPASVGPDGSVYAAFNDTTCSNSAGACGTVLGHYVPANGTLQSLYPAVVPGVLKMFFSSDGALWMTTIDGGEFYDSFGGDTYYFTHPVVRIPPGSFSQQSVQSLNASFGEPFGIAQDATNHVWLSSCVETVVNNAYACLPTAFVLPLGGPYTSPKSISLPSCGFNPNGSVRDIADLSGTMYVLGSQMLWKVSSSTETGSCVSSLPANFDPSPYFASLGNSLIFGIAGTTPAQATDHGFYTIANGVVTANTIPHSTPVAISAQGGTVYYYDTGLVSGGTPGVGTFVPASQAWNVLPGTYSRHYTAPPTTPPTNGVAATSNGAWFTVTSGSPGCAAVATQICIGQIVFLDGWGVEPGLDVAVAVGGSTTLDVTVDPQSPLVKDAAAAPFSVTTSSTACSVTAISSLVISIDGKKAGECLITISDTAGTKQQVLATVLTPGTSWPSGRTNRRPPTAVGHAYEMRHR